MGAKQLILDFYKSDALINSEVMDSYLHPEITIEWNSSKGLVQLTRSEIMDMTAEMARAYVRSKVRISHIIEEGDTVAVRFSHFVKTIENPREEMFIALFIVFWEVREGKLFKAYQMSQPS